MGVFQKGKKNSKYSYLDEKLRRLDEDLKKTGLVSSTKVQENIVEAPKITLPKNPSKEDIRLVSEYLENHSKSNWRNEYRVENGQKTKEEKVEEEISKLRIQRKPQKKLDCSTCVTESDLKSKRIIKEEVTFEDKVNKILQIYNEGLLNIPPSESTPDPLTPTDGKFVTFSQLNDHYNLFINRIQQQLSTLGGGGEVRLQYLDDIVGIATNPSVYDGKYLKYNDTLGKFEFSDVISGLTTETQTLNNVLNLGNTSSLGMSVGVITATSFIGDGSSLSGVITSLVGYSTEGYVDAAVAGVATFSGNYNDLTNKPTIPSDTGDLTNNVGFVTASIVDGYSTISYVDNSIAGIVSAAPGALDTLNELSAALGDDANFATTVTNSLATKANLTGANFIGVVTATSFDGNATTATYAELSGLTTTSTNVSGGVAQVTTLSVSGISTLNGEAQFGGVIIPSTGNGDNFGIQWGSDPGGGSGDKAYIRYYVQVAEENTRLTISNQNDSDDDIYLDTPEVNISTNLNVLGTNNNTLGNVNTGAVQIDGGLGVAKNLSLGQDLYVGGQAQFVGVVTATDFNSSSDLSLKENIEVIDNPLSKLLELRGVTFDWKETKKSGIGVVAQDVEKVLPQAVGGIENHKTVNYNAIIGLLVESVKQQQKEIEDLRKRLS